MKKFCMSIITRAVVGGERMMVVVVVGRVREEEGEGTGKDGGEGRVRSKVGGEAEWSQ